MSRVRPYCLSIAGFDPSGGAGLLADIKTFEQHRIIGLSVQTANTIQTEDEFLELHWTDKALILKQMDALIQRYPIQYVKIGLIEDLDLLHSVLARLNSRDKKTLVLWDPVLKASAGGNFDIHRFDTFENVYPNLDLWIMPNSIEFTHFEHLVGRCTVFLKGGHSENLGKDILMTGEKMYAFVPKIIAKNPKHGSGCVLSSALLSNLALGHTKIKSCLRAKRYIESLLISNNHLLGYHKR